MKRNLDNRPEEADGDDFETYAYQFGTQNYFQSPYANEAANDGGVERRLSSPSKHTSKRLSIVPSRHDDTNPPSQQYSKRFSRVPSRHDTDDFPVPPSQQHSKRLSVVSSRQAPTEIISPPSQQRSKRLSTANSKNVSYDVTGLPSQQFSKRLSTVNSRHAADGIPSLPSQQYSKRLSTTTSRNATDDFAEPPVRYSVDLRPSPTKLISDRRVSASGSGRILEAAKATPRESSSFNKHRPSQQISQSMDQEKQALDLAATKIQAHVRGHQTRKRFYREREHSRTQKKQSRAGTSRMDEKSFSSMTSVVDFKSVTNLSPNADPNAGLTAPLPTLDSTQKHQIIRELKSKLVFSDEIQTANQLQTETSPVIVILGGINPYNSEDYITGGSVFTYNIQKSKWYFGGTMPEPRNYHKAAFVNGKIFITGGYNPLQVVAGEQMATQSTFQLTVRSRRWRRRADMHHTRACHGMCIVEENIMVVGGRDSSGKLLSTVEEYYPKRDQWVLQKPMPEAIMGMTCTVMENCLWVMGGVVAEGPAPRYTVSNKCYSFDIQQQCWYHKASLPEPRAYASAVTLKREIWFFCGAKDELCADGTLESSNAVFTYSPEVGQWEHRTDLGTYKHAIAAAKSGRRVFILGGVANTSGTKEVLDENDCYNRETDKFTEGAPLPVPIAGTAAVSLPIDYVSSSDPKWEIIDEGVMNEAATRIQAMYRGFRTRSLLSANKFPVMESGVIKKESMNYLLQSEAYGNKWKMFQRVQIDDWPPLPDPRNLPSELNIRLGTLPKGYTVTAGASNGRTKIRRYVQLPSHADPNLAVCGHIGNILKKTKKILGLRKVEHMPGFTRDMLTVTTLQDDSLPTVLLMGGLEPKEPVNSNIGKLIMRYHPLKNRWEYFGCLPEPRNYHAALYYKETIYVTGGCDPEKRNSGEMVSTNTLYCLNINSSEWVQMADMNCSRSHHSLVAYQGRLYAVGGRDQNGRLVASIETYDIENDKWILKHPMSHPRMGMACAVFQESVWCFGGMGLSSEDSNKVLTYPVLSSVVSYSIAEDSWLSRPPLRCPRAFGTCIMVRDEMWLFGGASKDRDNTSLISMASVDKYYPDEAQWVRKTLLNTPRHCPAVVAVESCVYVFGGMSSQEWSALARNEMVVLNDVSIHSCAETPVPLTGIAAVVVPPISPSLRAESVAMLLHAQLTFH